MSREDFENDRGDGTRLDDAVLPPVKPPSAGFFVQLFVVPALIVLAVVAVWALFGKIASSDEDWRELVEDIRNTNEHRRWRGAYGLAMLLERDQQLGRSGQHLSTNPDIARALVGLFDEGLTRHSQRSDDFKQEAFLARTLGLLDSPDTVVPALIRGFQPEQDREVRKNSIASVAVIAGRADERHKPLASTALVDDLSRASGEHDPVIRDAATFALGLIPSSTSVSRLKVLTADSSSNTRVNAAVGLARQKSTAGFSVFKDVLSSASPIKGGPQTVESLLAVKNSLHAVSILASEWTPAERSQLVLMIDPISTNHAEPRIRADAVEALLALRKQ